MMRLLRATLLGTSLGICAVARAVYAPIPDQEQGKDLTLSIEAGVTYNTNIFGAATGAISSLVYEVSPKISFNSSLTDQTFFSASFRPTLDYFDNRPGSKTVYSQVVDARIAHSFSRTSALDVSDAYSYDQNPEAILNGVSRNTDQTLQSNEFNARFNYAPTEKMGVVLKARSMYYDYTNAALGDQLNRFENLYGIESDYTLLPDVKLAGEFRHQDVLYSNDPDHNNKNSDFLMAGFDYAPGPKASASVRVGAEYREYSASIPTTTTPYAELSCKYDYAKGSYISAGYTYDLEESSDPLDYADEKTNRFFVNIQHAFTPLIVGSASVDYEPSTLVGRPGHADVTENSTHAGVAITYLPTKNWTISGSYDYDLVSSGVASRDLDRSRVGLSATVVF